MGNYLHPSLRTRKRLPAMNEERLARRRERDTCEPHAERLRKRPCDGIPRTDGGIYHHPHCPAVLSFGRAYRCDASHVRTKGAGGVWHEQISQSRLCHREFEMRPPRVRRLMLPLAHWLAWQSHHACPDLVPAPEVPEGEENP